MSPTATSELWRVAETGDVDELERVLSLGVDVNSRSRYGMTALMRAAYHGHERVVRVLLDHGADPNLARNDRFTALALAAFFGHTGTVKALVEHGARTEVVTRCGASAYMWARARTFEEAASCLKSSTPQKIRTSVDGADSSALWPNRRQVAALQGDPPVRTLKDPPEIWDLVHEEPRSFDPRSAFVSRLKSMKASFVVRVAAVLLISAGCVVGVSVLKRSQAPGPPADTQSNQSAAETLFSVPAKSEGPDSEISASTTNSGEFAEETAVTNHHPPETSGGNTRANRSRKLYMLTRQTASQFSPADEPVETPQSATVPVAPTSTVATPQFESRSSTGSSAAKAKPNTGLSPQMIAPPKNSPPKGKVIQCRNNEAGPQITQTDVYVIRGIVM